MSEIISEAYQNKVVDGNLMVQNNLVVAGTLKAQEVKQPNMGLYPDIEALQAAIPSPEIGMWATVGDTVPGDIYRCDTAGVWSATGGTGGVDNTLYKGVAESIRNLSVTDEVLLLRMQGKDKDAQGNSIPHDNTFDPFYFKKFSGGAQAYLDVKEWLDSLHSKKGGVVPLGLLRLYVNGAFLYVLQNLRSYANDEYTQTLLNAFVAVNGSILPSIGIYVRECRLIDGVTTWTKWQRIGELDSATVQSMITNGIADKANTSDLATLVDNGLYNSITKKIELRHGNTILSEIDAKDFIKDGMVQGASVVSGYLVITFNTDSGTEDISIPISDIFNANNYYTKAEIDAQHSGIINRMRGETTFFDDPLHYEVFNDSGTVDAGQAAAEWLAGQCTTDQSIKTAPVGVLRMRINGSDLLCVNNVLDYTEGRWTQTILNGYVYPNGNIVPSTNIYTRESTLNTGEIVWGNWQHVGELDETAVQAMIAPVSSAVTTLQSVTQVLQSTMQTLQTAVSGKENVVELTQYLDSTKTLPQHGVYVYNGNPVNHLRVIPINDGEEAELVFCINHQEEPDTRYSELYILYAQTENGWVFVESWDKDDENLPEYIVKAFGEDYASQADLIPLNNAINSLGQGLTNLAQSFNSRLDNGYYTKQEMDSALAEKAGATDLSNEITRAEEVETELSNSISSLSDEVSGLPKFVTVEDYMPGGTKEGLFMPVGIYLYQMEPCEMRLRWSAEEERYLLYLYYEDSLGAKLYLVFMGANSQSIYEGYEYARQYNGSNVPRSVKELFGEYADATETAKGLMGVADKVKLNNIQQQVFDFTANVEDPSLYVPATTIEGITLLSGQNIYVYIESYEGRRELEVDTFIGLQVVGSGKQVVRCINRDNLQPGISASVAVSAVIDGAVNFNKTLTISTDGRTVTGKIIIA